jgi:hypothetical protein
MAGGGSAAAVLAGRSGALPVTPMFRSVCVTSLKVDLDLKVKQADRVTWHPNESRLQAR